MSLHDARVDGPPPSRRLQGRNTRAARVGWKPEGTGAQPKAPVHSIGHYIREASGFQSPSSPFSLITVDYWGRLQMVTFVACTLGDDTAILVNMDQVRTLVRDKRTGMTQVNFDLDHVIAVKEDPTDIQERIAAMR
jgi:hypothetical protein